MPIEYVRCSIRVLSTVRRRMKNQIEKRTSVLQIRWCWFDEIWLWSGAAFSRRYKITSKASTPSVSRNFPKVKSMEIFDWMTRNEICSVDVFTKFFGFNFSKNQIVHECSVNEWTSSWSTRPMFSPKFDKQTTGIIEISCNVHFEVWSWSFLIKLRSRWDTGGP